MQLCAMERWGQKKGAGFYDYDDKRRPEPVAGRPGDHRGVRDEARRRAARDLATRRSSSARSTRWSTRARRSSRKGSPSAPPTSMWFGSTVTAGRSIAAGRCSGPTASGSQKIVDGLKRQEQRMKPDFGFSQLLLDKAAKGEKLHAVKRWLGLALALAVAGGAATAASPRSAAAPTPATIERVVGRTPRTVSPARCSSRRAIACCSTAATARCTASGCAPTRYWISSTGKQFVAAASCCCSSRASLGSTTRLRAGSPKRRPTSGRLPSRSCCRTRPHRPGL